jgi:hypothetical protein
LRLLHCFQPAKQRGDARHQVRKADVLGQVIVGAQAQAGDRIKFTVTGCEKYDGQFSRARPQLATELEASLNVILEINVDDDKVRQAHIECLHGLIASFVRVDTITLALERSDVVFANGGFVFDDCNLLGQVVLRSEFGLVATICHITPVHCHGTGHALTVSLVAIDRDK